MPTIAKRVPNPSLRRRPYAGALVLHVGEPLLPARYVRPTWAETHQAVQADPAAQIRILGYLAGGV